MVVTEDGRADLGNGIGSAGSGSSDDVSGYCVGGADRDSSDDADDCL